MASEHPVKTWVLARATKTNDVETHLRRVEIDGMTSFAISDYVVSLGEYGRTVFLPADRTNLNLLVQALQQIVVQMEYR